MSKFSNVSLSQISITESIARLYFGTLAGLAGSAGSTDATGSAARFDSSRGVAVDASGNIFVADTRNSTIRKITSAGVVTTLAGLATSSGSTDGTGSAARFYYPTSVAVDTAGNIFVADELNYTIRKITSAGVVTTFAGTAGSGGSTDGTGSAARFQLPNGVSVDSAGNVFVADSYNHTIRKITSAGVVTTLAGSAGNSGSTDGTGSAARFNQPMSVAVDTAGNVFVADMLNHKIRKVTSAGVVTTLATGTSLSFPHGVAVDTAGNVFVADTFNHTINKITSAGVVTTLAGRADSAGSTDGIGSAARFDEPYGVAVDSAGNVFVADTDNHTIRSSTFTY
jgi:sugar lactone lactonase YvrE